METLVWPDGILPSKFKWNLVSNGTSFSSPWNGRTQTVRFPGSYWAASLTLSNLDDYESREVEVILFELDGMSGRIKLKDFGRFAEPVNGAPVVNGASQSGSNLITSGWTPSMTVLSKGNYITVNDELKMVLSDVQSDASGNATLRIAPMLRQSPVNGSAIEVSEPYAIFRLKDNENGVDRSPAFNNDFTLDFVEYF